jgi:hypothetical protein
MVSVLVITVASFQRRHNARYTTLESLKKSSMRFKLGTLMRSESQREKVPGGSARVETLAFRQLHVGRVVPALGSVLHPPIPVETGLRAGASQAWRIDPSGTQ